MISVRIVTGKEGVLILAEAEGHAGAARFGSDPVCAAVSVLFRTTAAVLQAKVPSVSVRSAGRGSLRICAEGSGAAGERFCLLYAAEFLLAGISSLAEEFPGYVELRREQT